MRDFSILLKNCRKIVSLKYQNISQYWYIIKVYVIFHLKIVLKIVVKIRARLRVMVFNATFNNISVVSWRSVFLIEETGVPGENHRPAASHRQTFITYIEYTSPERDSKGKNKNLVYISWRDYVTCAFKTFSISVFYSQPAWYTTILL